MEIEPIADHAVACVRHRLIHGRVELIDDHVVVAATSGGHRVRVRTPLPDATQAELLTDLRP